MNEMLLLFIVGVACTILGGIAHWWCWAKPRYAEYRENIAYWHEQHGERVRAYEIQQEYLHSARKQALEAERSLGYTLITQAAGDFADRVKTARMIRGRR